MHTITLSFEPLVAFNAASAERESTIWVWGLNGEALNSRKMDARVTDMCISQSEMTATPYSGTIVECAPDVLIACDAEGCVVLMQLPFLTQVQRFDFHRGPLSCIALNPSEEVLVVGCKSGAVILQPLPSLSDEDLWARSCVKVLDLDKVKKNAMVRSRSTTQGGDNVKNLVRDTAGLAKETVSEVKQIFSKFGKWFGSKR